MAAPASMRIQSGTSRWCDSAEATSLGSNWDAYGIEPTLTYGRLALQAKGEAVLDRADLVHATTRRSPDGRFRFLDITDTKGKPLETLSVRYTLKVPPAAAASPIAYKDRMVVTDSFATLHGHLLMVPLMTVPPQGGPPEAAICLVEPAVRVNAPQDGPWKSVLNAESESQGLVAVSPRLHAASRMAALVRRGRQGPPRGDAHVRTDRDQARPGPGASGA
jgi:hypothetical protein